MSRNNEPWRADFEALDLRLSDLETAREAQEDRVEPPACLPGPIPDGTYRVEDLGHWYGYDTGDKVEFRNWKDWLRKAKRRPDGNVRRIVVDWVGKFGLVQHPFVWEDTDEEAEEETE